MQACVLQCEEHGCQSGGVEARAPALEAAQTRPLEAGQSDEQRNQPRERGPRQQEQDGEQRGDEDRGGADPRSKLTFQATSARFADSSCSLVRPKRRSRLW
jgi:hypothetical protein